MLYSYTRNSRSTHLRAGNSSKGLANIGPHSKCGLILGSFIEKLMPVLVSFSSVLLNTREKKMRSSGSIFMCVVSERMASWLLREFWVHISSCRKLWKKVLLQGLEHKKQMQWVSCPWLLSTLWFCPLSGSWCWCLPSHHWEPVSIASSSHCWWRISVGV